MIETPCTNLACCGAAQTSQYQCFILAQKTYQSIEAASATHLTEHCVIEECSHSLGSGRSAELERLAVCAAPSSIDLLAVARRLVLVVMPYYVDVYNSFK